MNMKEKIEAITVDDVIKFDIEEMFEETTGKKPDGLDKAMIRDTWEDAEGALDLVKIYIIKKILGI